jgi:hypothetical protein
MNMISIDLDEHIEHHKWCVETIDMRIASFGNTLKETDPNTGDIK